MKIIRYFILVIILLFNTFSVSAVLKGDNVNETVIMLSSELEVFSSYVDDTASDFMVVRDDYKNKMRKFRKELTSAKLSLYSQQEQYIFGNAYASEIARNLCEDFYDNELPINLWRVTYKRAISRCEQLQSTLRQVDADLLNDEAKINCKQAIECIDVVLCDLKNWRDSIADDLHQYEMLVAEVKQLEKDIESNYSYILNTLLLSPDKQPTHKVFGSNFGDYWDACVSSIVSMVASSQYYGWEYQDKWTANTGFIIFAGIIAFILGFIIAYLLLKRLPEKWERIHQSPLVFYILCGWIAVAITYCVIKLAIISNPFFVSALILGIEMCLMCIFLNFSVLFVSDTIRCLRL